MVGHAGEQPVCRRLSRPAGQTACEAFFHLRRVLLFGESDVGSVFVVKISFHVLLASQVVFL